jgi:hypothetical protein
VRHHSFSFVASILPLAGLLHAAAAPVRAETQRPAPAIDVEWLMPEDDCPATPEETIPASEMRDGRPRPSPALNLFGLAKSIVRAVKKKGRAQYYVYRSESAGLARFVVRKGPMPDAERYRPGIEVELVNAFPDRDSATRAWQSLQQGGRGVEPASSLGFRRRPCAPRGYPAGSR